MYFNRKNAEQKNWRMIKKGKHFLFGCSLVFAIGAALVAPSVKADTVEANPEAGSTTEGINPVVAEEDVTYAAPAVEVAPSTLAAPATVVTEEKAEKPVATSPVATEAVEANSATTVISADKSQLEVVLAQAKAKNLEGQEASVKSEVAAAIAEAEAFVANGSASKEQVNQSVERLTQALASVKEVTEVAAETVSETTTESSETPKVRNKRAVEGSLRSVDESNLQRAVVTKENFESFFQEGGTATYDKSTGTIKLTDDVSGQVGSAYLRFKIDPTEPFTFTGKVDIGNKYEGKTDADGRLGGDGVGFVFHTGKVDTIGQNGASVGMGTIKNAFGFKLDSWHNTSNPGAKDNASADPKYGGNAWRTSAFGSFYSSNNAGKVTTSSSAAKALNPAPSGQWVDFKIKYEIDKNNNNNNNKIFTVTYGSQTWTTNLSKTNTSIMTVDAKNALNAKGATFALSFLGSTGDGTNLQRVQIERFEFTAPQIVHMKFVDTKGNEIEASSAIPGDRDQVINLSTQDSKIAAVEAKGYKLKEIDSTKAPSYIKENNTVKLTPGGQLLTYIFEEKEKDAASIQAPTNKVPVKNTTALTEDEKSSVETAVKAVNPKATKVEVATDGAATVTFEDGSTATLTGDKTVKEADSKGVKAPTTKTPVQNTSSLTQPEKDAVKKAVEGANPSATKVEVGNDGSATVTFPDGSTATLTGDKTVKEADSKGVKAPATKTPVQNTSSLTQPEKDAVKKAVSTANPSATKVEVGNDGSATVTFPDGTTATLTGDKTVKEADSKGVKAPATKTPVQNTSSLTQPEKDAVKKAVSTANPSATKVEVGNDGSATVTFPDGSTATLTGDKTVKEADSKGVQEPAAKTPVQNTSSLTQPEKDAVKKAVADANPTATKVEVGNDGSATVTFPDGTTATLTGDKTVKEADSKGVKAPATKTPVQNTSSLTQPEKDAVKKAVSTANPSATKVEVGNDGSATVTFPDGTTATLTGDKTVKEADSKGVKAPATKTPVQNTSSLTQPEKDAVKKAVSTANPSATKVEVGNDGSATVTFPDGTTATLTGDKTVKEADSKGVKAPATKTPVQNTSSLTQPEKDAVKKAVSTANPSATKVEVGNDGSATVTFPDGTTATLTGDKTVKEADSKGVKAPATKTPVQNTSSLTQPEKDAVKKAVSTANPSATKVEVGNDGSATVTFPDGTTATLTGDKTVKEADSKGVKAPTTKTPAQNTSSLTQPEKDAVKKAVEGANPSATKVEVGNDGSATVTFPDGSTATLTPAQTVVKAEEKAKDADGLKAPETKTPVKDTANLTDAEKAEVKKAVEAANPGSVAEVGQDGTTKVTFPDKSEGTLTPAQTVVKAKDAASIKEPATKTPVKDTANLTDDEKAEVKKAVEAANPGSVAEVGQDGTTKVTFPDKSEGTLTPAQTVVKAKDAAGIKEPATKTPVKDTAKLTDDEKAEVKKAVEAANPGSVAEVGQDGTTKVTFPDKSEGTLTPAQTVVKAEEKAKDADGLKAPETKTPVKDTANLTDDEKAEVKKAVEAANPRSVAEVGQDGTTKVTFPDKSEGTLTGDQTVKAADANGAKAPATKTPVKDTSTLTDEEKTQVAEEILKANPTLEDVDVANDGTATVTFPDGSKATLTPAQTVVKAEEKAKEADGLKAPATKTPVKDTANLTDAEKAEVKKAVEAANPGSVAEVGQDGTTKVTFPDKSEGTLTPAQTVVKAEEKAKDADGLKAPATKTPVKDTAKLTDDEKAEVKKAVEAANPGSVAEVGQDGTTKVTFPDKSEGTLTPAQTVVKAEEKAKDADGLKAPETKTPVKDTANLTDAEKAEVKKAVEAANPGSVAEVGQDGTTKVTFPDKSEGTLTPAQTVVKAKDAAGIKEPATKTPVKDTAKLTDDEKAEVKKAVEAANPGSVAEVGQDGTTKVTFPDKSEGTLTPAQTVVKAEEKAKDADGLKAPETKTPVKDTANLTDDEKAEVKKAVEAANPRSVAEVGQDGTTKVTFPDKSEGTLTGDQTVKAADANGAKAPATKTPVKDTSTLTDEEKTQVAEEILKANPTLEDVDVANDGTATVTFPDGSKATLTPAQTVVKAEEKAKEADGLKAPETKTPVKDTANLTDAEKAEVKKAVEAANPGSVAEVGQDGTTKVTFPDKSEGTLTPEQTVVKAEEKAKDADGLKAPETKTPVKDTANLTDAEKAEVKKAVEAANPGSVAEVGQDGTTTVTFPDGSTATLTPAQTVVKAEEKAKDADGLKAPATKTPVKDTANLTDAEKAEVKKAVEAANPGSVAEVGQDGTTKVTFPDKSEGTLTPAQTVVKAEEKAKDADGLKAPATKTPVQNTSALTQPEKDAVKKAVADANPTATKVEVGNDGSATVTFPDGSTATLTPSQTVVKAEDKEAPTAPVVNPVKAGDTAVTGTAEAGSTVEVTLPDGTKVSAKADKDGNYSVPVSGLKEGDKVSVTATDEAGNKSGATDATVAKADDKAAPAAPVVNPVKAGDTAVTGTAEAGSTVEVTLPDGTKVSAKADKDGNYSVPVSGLKEGDKVSVTATDEAGNKSGATDATVAKAEDKEAPTAPVVNPVKAGDTAVTGTVEAGSTVEVTLPDGTKVSAKADKDGNYSVPVSGLKEGDKVSVTATDEAGNKSGATDATVAKADDKEAPAAPVVNDVKEGDKAVTGTAEVGSIIEITLPNSETVTVRADEAGHFSLPVVGLKAGDKVTAVAKDASGNTSTPTEKTVGKRDVKDADGIQAPSTKTPVKDTANLTDDEKAEVKKAVEAANPGSVAEVGQDGTTKVTFPDKSEGTLTPAQTVVKAKDAAGIKEPATKTPVKDTANLTEEEKAEVKKAVEAANPGTVAEVGQDGTTKVTFPDKSERTLTPAQTVKAADANGVKAPAKPVPVKNTDALTEAEKTAVTDAVKAVNPGTEVSVADNGEATVTFPDGSTATLTGDKTVTQADITAPTAPVVNPVKAGDTAITGTAEAGSTVEVTLPDGTKVSAKADKDGNFSVPVSGLEEGKTVSVTSTDDAGNTSDAATATVAKADDKTAPNAPVVNPVKAGDTAVTGTAEAGSTVEVTLPDGTKVSAKADKDGNFSVPVNGLNAGDTVSVTATDKAGNKSDATTATVAKADDKTAPTAPVVNPVKAGDTAITGTAEAGSTVEVTLPNGSKVSAKADKDGKFSIPVNGLNAGDTVSVTATDESGNTSATTTVTVSNVNVGGKEADNAKVPALTPVVDPNNLTDAEKAKVAEEVKKANPTATDVKVNNDGSVVVTFADGSVATIAANKVVKEATKESSAQAPAKKAGAKELPNTGTKQSNASLGLALLAAVTGGLLVSKKRKEEE